MVWGGAVRFSETGKLFPLDDFQIRAGSARTSDGKELELSGERDVLGICYLSWGVLFGGAVRVSGECGVLAPAADDGMVFTIDPKCVEVTEPRERQSDNPRFAEFEAALDLARSGSEAAGTNPVLSRENFDIRFIQDAKIAEERDRMGIGDSEAYWVEVGELVALWWDDARVLECRDPGDDDGRLRLLPLARDVFARMLLGEFECTRLVACNEEAKG